MQDGTKPSLERRRGRPKQYDKQQAISAAMQVFWTKGLSATSLDDLATAMNMNRPSIYNAFGSKENIYLEALNTFSAALDQTLTSTLGATTLGSTADFQSGLLNFYYQAINVYCEGDAQLGCFMACTAPAEAISYVEIQTALNKMVSELDQKISMYIQQAINSGQLTQTSDPLLAAKMIQGTLQSFALRARAGETKSQLRKLARFSIEYLK
ncbi:MAG: AcrR family transcriptional regulator [Candidatus Azotimanducaceae bacterium]|jgi:AcrR family transcriptional regulator